MTKKTKNIIYLIALIALVIFLAFNWADMKQGFVNGYNDANPLSK